MKKKITNKEEQLTFRVNSEPLPENISPVEIHQIACSIKDGEADPKDAKHLMESFCDYVNKEVQGRKQVLGCPPDKQIPKELLWHFRDAFKSMLEGKTPEQALGIAGRPGRATKPEFHINVATEYLKLAIKGIKPTTIKKQLESRFGPGKSQLEGIWKKYKVQALWQLRDEREKNNHLRLLRPESLWRPKEKKILEEIYPWKDKDKKRLEENRNPMRNKKTRSKRKIRPKSG